MIIKIKVSASYGFVGAKRHDEMEIEVPDTATDNEIDCKAQQAAYEWAVEYVDSYAEIKKP